MRARKQLAAKCCRCGRTIAFANQTAARMAAVQDMQSVIPYILRPHKCPHGTWCDECQQCAKEAR